MTTEQQQTAIENQSRKLDGLATACAVFDPHDRILVIQRAAHDSMPNRWELPGGAVDDGDQSILHGAARELLEESGLIAKHLSCGISEGPEHAPGSVFHNRTGTSSWCRFCFNVEVDDCTAVKLDPNEHQDFAWASRDEICSQRKGDRPLPITTDSVVAIILEAFRLRSAQGAKS
ncbi:hypothetical protein DOTSEDRAFT_86622 [Dothistroma septosporum NZE10]|uniref:Nudix hydrolase domain-containing protein n=1 Tax=Dothistroma septosporum (strain NZE10 / CBS 128990) TaxID=675120 RepID=N1PR59_DOTSN|nr:hypothetical protein DOTSEDRAFT_86622 [Dothistroma septosporum NZE10]